MACARRWPFAAPARHSPACAHKLDGSARGGVPAGGGPSKPVPADPPLLAPAKDMGDLRPFNSFSNSLKRAATLRIR